MPTDFNATRAAFDLPEGVIYLDGNSLGPLPRGAVDRLAQVARDEWGQHLIRAWNSAGWMDQPDMIGDRIARLIGADPGSVTVGDTLSVKVFQALSAALELAPDRKIILSDNGNFPSDLYMAQGLIGALDRGHRLVTPAPQEVEAHLSEDVAVLMLTEVDYRTGRRHDMARLTRRAQELGIVTVWDLAHSAGAVDLDIAGLGVDFAVGCTYKFLNGGPGAPGFIAVRPDLADRVRPSLSGWLGHEAPFAFDQDYRPAEGVRRLRVGTPPVLAMAALETALDVWDRVDMADLRDRSLALSSHFIDAVEAQCPDVTLATPRDPAARGSQVSFRHPQGYAVMQALIAEGVIGDFRAPDILRFGITPLFIDEGDLDRAAGILARILKDGSWDRPEFHRRVAVT
ncbi:kynureninase [Oceanomicrobium pacificus]|uniref:Kynureninase n=1 Tax=Oceanomicrobium pacificus TaxID=2692916 RepID=A0A6B0TPB8_9RHOB|nr:kynureninase [Oceanomicrobium pacificus]MXU65736.1 kynureninase [Oceanomicrobium pacificus]